MEAIFFALIYCMVSFLDINECLNTQICNQDCTNTIGSYFCSCEPGSLLNTDMKTCTGWLIKNCSLQVMHYDFNRFCFPACIYINNIRIINIEKSLQNYFSPPVYCIHVYAYIHCVPLIFFCILQLSQQQ